MAGGRVSIAALSRATVCCAERDRWAVLDALQTFGRMHLDPPPARDTGSDSASRRGLIAFLRAAPTRSPAVTDDAGEPETSVLEDRVGAVKDELRRLAEERDSISVRLRELAVWGDFDGDAMSSSGLNLWFYRMPRDALSRIPPDVAWQQAGVDKDIACVVVAGREEPAGMPGRSVSVDGPGPSALRARRDTVEERMIALQEERAALAAWSGRLERDLTRFEDESERRAVAAGPHRFDGIFVVEGWIARADRDALLQAVGDRGGAAVFREPVDGDNPPTLLQGTEWSSGGRALVRFYLTPAYSVWDPSGVVALSFVVFFGMMLADAGYALVVLAGLTALALSSRHSGRPPLRRGLAGVAWGAGGFAFVWGALCGSWFGVMPAADGVAGRLHVLPLQDASVAMRVAVLTGVAHLILANLFTAWHRRASAEAILAVGWMLTLAGGATLWLGEGPLRDSARLEAAGWVLLVLGATALLGTALSRGSILEKASAVLALGFRALTAVGDTLSYLRLFALALAGAQLGDAFNDLAQSVEEHVPAFGAVLAGGILIAGHAFNLGLATAGAVVHGLRLNYVEFFNWAVWSEGTPFRPFAKREHSCRI